MFPTEFKITDEHVILLRLMVVGWVDVEYGAPEINPKRPYGNSDVERDIGEALGWEIGDEMSTEDRKRAAALHSEMQTALQVFLHAGTISVGTYRNTDKFAPYGTSYTPVTQEPTP